MHAPMDCMHAPMDCSTPDSPVHGSPGKNTGVGLPCPPPGNLPDPGIDPTSLALQANSLPTKPPGKHLRSVVYAVKVIAV